MDLHDCKMFGKLLAFLKRREKNPLEFTLQPPKFEIIIVPPEQFERSTSNFKEKAVEEDVKEIDEQELCEEPLPFQPFHAVNARIAREKAAKKGLLILFKERDRWDLYSRKNVFVPIPPETALKILRLEKDMKSEAEFTAEELAVLRDMVLKGWLKKLENGGTYYYGLHPKTAVILKKQLSQTF